MTIKSKIHSNVYVKPISVWILFNLIVASACSASNNNDSYHYMTFITIILISTIIISVVIFFIICNQKVLIIDNDKIIYKNDFNGTCEEFLMKDISNYKYSVTTSTKSVFPFGMTDFSSITKTKIYFLITFKNNESLKIKYGQFSNFDEIRKYFFRYCIQNNIIEHGTGRTHR
jgi:hypothetical protein